MPSEMYPKLLKSIIMKNTKLLTVSGVVVNVFLMFAVLFDPTELALGSQFVTLPGFAEVIATGLGNITWILGVMFMFFSAMLFLAMTTDDGMEGALAQAKKTGWKKFKPKWYSIPLLCLGLIGSLLALGSGFWFTGFFWLTTVIAMRVFASTLRKQPEYKEAIASA